MMLHFATHPFSELSALQVHDIFKLRQDIFIVEQDCPYPDIDGTDTNWLHLCGFDDEGLVAYARLHCPGDETSEIGRVVVAQRGRGKSYGRELMQRAVVEILARAPAQPIELNAQTYLLEFYGSLGFTVIGEEYLEDGIPHRLMEYRP
ncbi:GNAT family N-acetyltransferase [Aliidiomarina iranensis]|uniref:GNAT family N-acetyltransferase n=1 Tax=Aliidiomarina iranensis TaxID=1434071 RepID=A0A432VR65_9GAMM|nr:GNAT family N-acetyltransferase [Aliidiomarina iranensis]RUO18729.1 GNAT family N-acetyltransferase [Aliidiomarina iranensis]